MKNLTYTFIIVAMLSLSFPAWYIYHHIPHYRLIEKFEVVDNLLDLMSLKRSGIECKYFSFSSSTQGLSILPSNVPITPYGDFVCYTKTRETYYK